MLSMGAPWEKNVMSSLLDSMTIFMTTMQNLYWEYCFSVYYKKL